MPNQRLGAQESHVNYSFTKPHTIAIAFAPQEVVELKMIVQDEDQQEALLFLRQLLHRINKVEARHCGDPDRLPGL